MIPFWLHCGRSNPLDAKSSNYVPGKKPTAHFSTDRLSQYIGDTAMLSIHCTDTAIGGRQGAIRIIYLGWKNASLFDDSVHGSDAMDYIYKNLFPLGTWTIRIQAVDSEGRWSDKDSMVLSVLPSEPRIDSIRFDAKVEINTADTLFVSASDIGGTVRSFLWAHDGATFGDSSGDGVCIVTFSDTGSKKVLVKVRDDKNMESPPFTVFIRVYERPDTTGPALSFVNVKDHDTVSYGKVNVYIQAMDESSVSAVSINGMGLQPSGGLWKGEVPLATGENTLVVSAIDGRGNRSEKQVSLYFFVDKNDNLPPVILFKNPSRNNDTVDGTPYTIKVAAIDLSGIDRVACNDREMTVDTSDTTYVTTVDLLQGKNRFVISASDKKSNAGSDTLIVWYEPAISDKTPPLIAITDPQNDRHLADTVIVVKGTATDENRISSLLVNGLEATRSYPNWSAKVSLHYGYDTLRVTAVDSSAGRNTASDSVIVIQNVPAKFLTTASELDTTIPVGHSYTATVVAVHPENDRISFQLLPSSFHSDTLPVVAITGKTAAITYRPSTIGIDSLSVEVKDSWNDGDTLRWRVVVKP